MIGVHQVVTLDGEVVGDLLQSMPVASIHNIESIHTLQEPNGRERKLVITIEFDRALVPRELTR